LRIMHSINEPLRREKVERKHCELLALVQ